MAVAFPPDGKTLAPSSLGRTVRLWPVRRTNPRAFVKAPLHADQLPKRVFALAYSPDGRRIAVGQEGGAVTILDGATAKEMVTLAHHPGLQRLALSPRGDMIATAGEDRRIRLWRIPTK